MIAQVFTGKIAAGGISDEMRKFTEAALLEAHGRDGVEGCVDMSDPATGETLTVVLFHDQAALDAYQAWSKEKVAEVEALEGGVAVEAATRTYSDVFVAL